MNFVPLLAAALVALSAYKALGLDAVCQRPCSCSFGSLSCNGAANMTALADVSRFDFLSIRLAHTNIKTLECTQLSPNLRLLDLRGTPMAKESYCALALHCSKIQSIQGPFTSEECAAVPETTPEATEIVGPVPQPSYGKVTLALGIVFGLLSTGGTVATFLYFRWRNQGLRAQFRQEIHTMFALQESEFDRSGSNNDTQDPQETIEMDQLPSSSSAECPASPDLFVEAQETVVVIEMDQLPSSSSAECPASPDLFVEAQETVVAMETEQMTGTDDQTQQQPRVSGPGPVKTEQRVKWWLAVMPWWQY